MSLTIHQKKKVSLTKRTKDEENISPDFKALIPVCVSPSKWHYCRPISAAKTTACLAATISKHSIECGFRIFSAIVAITWPIESLITTPTPASSLSLNIAPSKFALNFMKHGRGTRGAALASDAATCEACCCPRLQLHPAVSCHVVFG